MAHMETELRINAPRKEVWDLITQTNRWPELIDGIDDGEVLSENARGIGAEFRWDTKIAGISFSVYERFIDWAEEERLTYTSLERSRMEYEGTIAFEDVNGGTQVVSTLDYELPIWLDNFLFKRIFQHQFEKKIISSFENAKEILEG